MVHARRVFRFNRFPVRFAVLFILFGWCQIEASGQLRQPQKAGERTTIAKFGCSLPVPEGWERKQTANDGIMFSAPKASGYRANINVTSDVAPVSLREYANAVIKMVEGEMKESKLMSEVAFATDAAPAIKVTMSSKRNGKDMVQTLYFFEVLEGRKIFVIATAYTTQNEELLPLFDSCMKGLKPSAP
jgi:hypothetical protein